MANLALGRCVSTGPDNVSLHDTNHHIDFNYEFLDDTYTPYKPNDRAKLKHELKEHGGERERGESTRSKTSNIIISLQ